MLLHSRDVFSITRFTYLRGAHSPLLRAHRVACRVDGNKRRKSKEAKGENGDDIMTSVINNITVASKFQ